MFVCFLCVVLCVVVCVCVLVVFVCVCLNVFVLFVDYCAMLYGLGVVDRLFSVRVRVLFYCVCSV